VFIYAKAKCIGVKLRGWPQVVGPRQSSVNSCL